MHMEKLIIKGGHRLTGHVKVAGTRETILPIMAATILASSGKVVLSNVPPLADIATMTTLLRSLTLTVNSTEDGRCLTMDATAPVSSDLAHADGQQLRLSLFILGPLLARTGSVRIPWSSREALSLVLGDFPVQGLRQLGIAFDQHDGYIEARADRLTGANIRFTLPSVEATQSIMMTATLARGITTIENAACDPEVIDLANMLNKMGARVHGAGTAIIRIQGVDFLHGCEYSVMADRIEAGALMIAAAATNGDVVVEGVAAEDNIALIKTLEEMGVTVIVQDDGIRVLGTAVLLPTNVKAAPYPGFAVKLLPPISVLQLLTNGVSLHDGVQFGQRYYYLRAFRRMNANFEVQDDIIVLKGPTHFHGTTVSANDRQSEAALIIAGLVAEGITVVDNLTGGNYHFAQQLQQLGADIDEK